VTTSYAYLATDRANVRAQLVAQMPTAYMTANLSSGWRGWRDAAQTLDLGAAGTINTQKCGAIWDLQQPRPPYPVGDMEAAWARDYVLLVTLRRQSDPTDIAIVDTFDELLKTRLKDVYLADPARDIYDLSAPWGLQEVGGSFIDTVHVIRMRMVT
jgi:hypothetical protein